MILAGTPKNWPDGPSMSALHVLLVFVGIPLLVILTVSLLVYAPSWVKAPRYRPGQTWEATSEWFGAVATARTPSTGSAAGAETAAASSGSGGASADW